MSSLLQESLKSAPMESLRLAIRLAKGDEPFSTVVRSYDTCVFAPFPLDPLDMTGPASWLKHIASSRRALDLVPCSRSGCDGVPRLNSVGAESHLSPSHLQESARLPFLSSSGLSW